VNNIISTVLETPHVIVGAAIAAKIGNPALSLPLALGSHFLLDRIPHWNPHLNTEKRLYGKVTTKSLIIIIADSTLALGLGLFVASKFLPDINRAFFIIMGCFLGILPDLIESPYFFLGQNSKIIEKWISFQKSIQVDAPPLIGLTTQVITVIASLFWIFS